MSYRGGWIGVDLDGTLAHYDHWRGVSHIGAPVPLMQARVLEWLAQGKDVRIFTARVSCNDPEERLEAQMYIQEWCLAHVGKVLPITCRKDTSMIELWDDRAIRVIPNTGEVHGTAN